MVHVVKARDLKHLTAVPLQLQPHGRNVGELAPEDLGDIVAVPVPLAENGEWVSLLAAGAEGLRAALGWGHRKAARTTGNRTLGAIPATSLGGMAPATPLWRQRPGEVRTQTDLSSHLALGTSLPTPGPGLLA